MSDGVARQGRTGDLHGIVFYAADVDRLVQFYRGTLGLQIVQQDVGFVVLSSGGTDLNIVAMPLEAVDSLRALDAIDLRQDTAIKPSFHVSSLAQVATAAEALGGGTKPLEAAWEFRGSLHLDGYDPEGNVIQFVAPVDQAAD
jgi:catechol 2,3-dioxygenase-like lactoylglutathione lyase family enzyme